MHVLKVLLLLLLRLSTVSACLCVVGCMFGKCCFGCCCGCKQSLHSLLRRPRPTSPPHEFRGGAGLGLGTCRVRLLGRPPPPWHRHESIKNNESRNCFRTMSKIYPERRTNVVWAQIIQLLEENHSLEERPEGITTKGNS